MKLVEGGPLALGMPASLAFRDTSHSVGAFAPTAFPVGACSVPWHTLANDT